MPSKKLWADCPGLGVLRSLWRRDVVIFYYGGILFCCRLYMDGFLLYDVDEFSFLIELKRNPEVVVT